MKKTPFDWPAWKGILLNHNDVFDPLREYLEWHFGTAERIKLAEDPTNDGYSRRPTIGLRLQLPQEKTLALRPGWTPPRKRDGRIRVYGELRPGVVTVELLGPGKLLGVELEEGKPPKPRYVRHDMARNRANLRTVLAVAHDLLTDPLDLFARQADKCCCCGRALADVVSRTRGIGPECIRMFGTFSDQAQRPSAVDRYRLRYQADTGFLPAL